MRATAAAADAATVPACAQVFIGMGYEPDGDTHDWQANAIGTGTCAAKARAKARHRSSAAHAAAASAMV